MERARAEENSFHLRATRVEEERKATQDSAARKSSTYLSSFLVGSFPKLLT